MTTTAATTATSAITRSRKRRGPSLVEEHDQFGDGENKRPAMAVPKEKNRDELCYDDDNAESLGYCRLDEISYYQSLKLKFNPNQTTTKNFILKVNSAANAIVEQVRQYNSVDDKHYFNTVRDVLVLIENARVTLTDANKKARYDNVLKIKNATELHSCNRIVESLFYISGQLGAEIKQLQLSIGNFLAVRTDIDFSEMYNPRIVSHQFIPRLAESMYEQMIAENTKKIVKRPTTMNRLQIDWPLPLPEEESMTREQIAEQIIRPNFSKYGEIKFIYVCPMNKTRAIVEYATFESVQNAMDAIKNDGSIRFSVKEFLISHYYNNSLFETINEKINNIQQNLNELKNNMYKT
ncbi:djbp [Catopsilia pomona nucleopolyhedrovirus]|uniref:Djbp n=1 Tax=Catopsilia pomona nucleopolyhedrovirus TaxID=1850906 RepID=A0A172WZE9_9ABAC|nr:djbp [Catopsilia pomona nucleopolyhedrovirus]ANF29737.1 djbp [Catopsilia pomona nucleopolyhedrovirus]